MKKNAKPGINVERLKVKAELKRISFDECEGGLKEFITKLYECLEKYEHAPCTNISIEFDTELEDYDGHCRNNELIISGIREETDTEFAQRIELEAQAFKKHEEHNRLMYEQLKAHFEKTYKEEEP